MGRLHRRRARRAVAGKGAEKWGRARRLAAASATSTEARQRLQEREAGGAEGELDEREEQAAHRSTFTSTLSQPG